MAALLLAVLSTLSCGSNRQLQSITINATYAGANQWQLTATGKFSAAPLTVTPLPVSWSGAPPAGTYSLTTQPFVIQCAAGAPAGPWVAMAPADPHAASSGSTSSTKMVSETTGCASGNL